MSLTKEKLIELIKEEVQNFVSEAEVYTEIYIDDPTLDDGTIVEDLGFWDDELMEAYYQGRKVTLNKPTRGDVKKFKVYVNSGKKDSKGRIKAKKVNFGDKNMKIKKSNPKRRKSFRARHNCDNPGPKTKARYWSCKKWQFLLDNTIVNGYNIVRG